TIFVMPSSGVADRIGKVLSEYEVKGIVNAEWGMRNAENASDENQSAEDSAVQSHNSSFRIPHSALILVGDLSVGFALPQCQLTIYTEGDLFDEIVHAERERSAKSKRSLASSFISDFRDLKIGDFVVHIDHGIGQFQ